MNNNRKLAGQLFAQAFKERLKEKYIRVPSAAKIADAFNLRAHGTSTISRETARKWLKGEGLPEIGKLNVLLKWLNLKPEDFLDIDPSAFLSERGTQTDYQKRESANPKSDWQFNEVLFEQKKLLRQGFSHSAKLLALLDELTPESIEILLFIVWAIQEVKRTKTGEIDFQKLAKLLS